MTGENMKKKKLLSLLLCIFMVGCTFFFTGCNESEIPGGDTPGGDTPGGDTPGGDIPGVVPEYEESHFGDDVIVLTAENGEDVVFSDYYGTESRSFNYLVDRQIGLIASEIINRLSDVYGDVDVSNNSFLVENTPYTNWQTGQAVSSKYAVHIKQDIGGDVPYVFLYDSNGEKIVVSNFSDEEYVWDETTNTNYAIVTPNNIDDYLDNYSAYALTCYLLNGNSPSDSYGSGLGDNSISQMTILRGSISGQNYYTANGTEISLGSGESWEWANYIQDGSAVDRLKFAIAYIINQKGNIDPSEILVDEYYQTEYTNQISNIDYLGNYLEYYRDTIESFVKEVIIGSNIINKDKITQQTLNNILENAKTYNNIFNYIIELSNNNNDTYIGAIRAIYDIDNRNDEGANYNLLDTFEESKLFTNYAYINNNAGTRTFADEYKFLIDLLEIQANTYLDNGNEYYKPYYDLYYGIDGSHYVDGAQTIKSFDSITFPYDWESMLASRNFKNYNVVVDEILTSIQNQTFASDTHAGQRGYEGVSAFAEMGRVGQDKTITKMDQFGETTTDSMGNQENTYTQATNYRSIIIPAVGDILDLSHYSLMLCIGDNAQDMAVRVNVQLVDSNGNGQIITLDKNMAGLIEGFPYPDDGVKDDNKFIVPAYGNDSGLGNNTWFIEFNFPTSETTIAETPDEVFSFGNQTPFDNDFVLNYDENTKEVTYSVIATNSLVITFEVFDASGKPLPTGVSIPFGVSIGLDNYFQIN